MRRPSAVAWLSRTDKSIKIHSIMKKEISGEYLAPEIKVMEVHSRAVLCVSPDLGGLGIDDNPFGSNTEDLW